MSTGMLGNNKALRAFWNGPLLTLIERINGPEGEEELKALNRFLRKENPWPHLATLDEIPVWRSVKLGGHKSYRGYCQSLTRNGNRVSEWGMDILKNVRVKRNPTEVNLVLVTGRDLGFSNAVKRSAIYAKALSLGLKLCDAEVGPALREQCRERYPDQPRNEHFYIGMQPIKGSDGELRIFLLENEDSLVYWLHGWHGDPDRSWDPNDQWVFVKK